MADNFDLKKFLKESKALENLNPILRKENLNEGDLRAKIKEMILAELGNPEYSDYDEIEDIYNDEKEALRSFGVRGNMDEPIGDYYSDDFDPRLMEAKKDEEEVEVEDTETEEAPAEETPKDEEAPAEETPKDEKAPKGGGGLEDVAANMEGTEGELMKNLMDALKIAKGMNNEKLETQVGNTLKFFVSEYIGNEEEK